MNIEKWLSKNTHSLEGKTVAITGATGGLGEELCRYLTMLGARLILICRSQEKFFRLKQELLILQPAAKIQLIKANLEDMESLEDVADALISQGVDTLILNAGAYNIPRKLCTTGFNNIFQINFLSQYYLARKLLPFLSAQGGRVVAVSSIAHNYSKTSPDNIDFSEIKASSKVYGNAKRYLTYALFGLFRKENSATLSIVHPGITFTNITAHYPKLIFVLIKNPMKLIFMKPRVACLSILQGVFQSTPDNHWIGPSLFNIWGAPKLKTLNTADRTEADRIFKIAEESIKQYSTKYNSNKA